MPLRVHNMIKKGNSIEKKVLDLLDKVELPSHYRFKSPITLGGGERQMVAIARALATDPSFMVLDEPTSALDVSVKAQVINLLHDLQAEMGLSILFISHELNVIRSLADEIAVMYRGCIVEQASTEDIFQNAQHPYTKSLLNAIPSLDPRMRKRRDFLTAEQLADGIPTFSKTDVTLVDGNERAGPQLVNISETHKVEAFVTG